MSDDKKHKNVLNLLMPLQLDGRWDEYAEVVGAELDAIQVKVDSLLNEMFPDTAYDLLPDWEREYGITPEADAPLQKRRDMVIQKCRARGGLSRTYFIALAAAMGYTITIEEEHPFIVGWSEVGVDPLNIEKSIYVWRVNVSGQPVYQFEVGLSVCGERLLWWPGVPELENLFNELKPGGTYVYFSYE